MEIIRPTLSPKIRVCGVYKITFNNNWFYIGSSANLKHRFESWVCRFNKPSSLKNKNIKHIFPSLFKVEFEIIEQCVNDIDFTRGRETFYINENWENELLLNLCKDGFSHNGIRQPHLLPQKPKRDKGVSPPPKKVCVFDLDGNLIKTCESYGKCSREFNIKNGDISRILSGKRGQPRKIRLRLP